MTVTGAWSAVTAVMSFVRMFEAVTTTDDGYYEQDRRGMEAYKRWRGDRM